jgi:spoIIIJ-associated protein
MWSLRRNQIKMERVIITGKTIEEALSRGLAKLNTTEDMVEYKVLEEAQSGFLGLIGRKDAKIELIKRIDKKEKAKEFLEELIKEMELNLEVKVIKDNNDKDVVLNITGDDLAIIIGHRGKTLDSLQYLTNLAVNKGKEDYLRVILDAEGYRERRKETLENLALKMANKAKKTGRKVMLEPMPPQERKVIHAVLHNKSDINTYSVGKEPYRKVVIVKE